MSAARDHASWKRESARIAREDERTRELTGTQPQTVRVEAMPRKRAYLVLVANGGASAVAVDEDKIEAAEACTSGYVAIEVGHTEYEGAKDALARIMPEPS